VFSIVLLLLLVLIVWRGGLKLLVLLSSSVQGTAGMAGGSRSMVSFLQGRRRPAVFSGLNLASSGVCCRSTCDERFCIRV
jgi:hypothetical protein